MPEYDLQAAGPTTLGKSQVTGDRDCFAVLVSVQTLLIRQDELSIARNSNRKGKQGP